MWPFKKSETNVSLVPIYRRLDEVEAAYESLLAQHRALRGRVYSIWGKSKDAQEATETPREQLPLTDPRLTKAEVRARLRAAGALKPYDPKNPPN